MTKRRTVLGGLVGFTTWLLAARSGRSTPPATPRTQADVDHMLAETRDKLIASIPYKRVETTGTEALAIWNRLRAAGRGWPVVIGGDEALARIADQIA